MTLENFALSDVVVPEEVPAAEPETAAELAAEPAPINPHVPTLAFRSCRHCGAEYPLSVKGPCPGCGKNQAGRPAGKRSAKEAPPPPPPKSEKEMLQIEQAIGDTFAFVCEDLVATRMLAGTDKKAPPFGNRGERLGAVWAPILAPYINGPFLLALVAIAITVRGLGSYFRECIEVRDAANPN